MGKRTSSGEEIVIHQVGYNDKYSEHQGYTYHLNKAEAQKAIREYNKGVPKEDRGVAEIVGSYSIPKTSKGWVELLNTLGGHPDNG